MSQPSQRKPLLSSNRMPYAIGLGLSLGLIVGTFLGNLAIGLIAGAVLGWAVGVVLEQRERSKHYH